MRRLRLLVTVTLVACAGCSSFFWHSWEESTESWGGIFHPRYSDSGRAIHAPDGDYSWAESEPKKK
jgi:hypothetical protein